MVSPIDQALKANEELKSQQRILSKLQNRFEGHKLSWYKRNESKRIFAVLFSYLANVISLMGLFYTITILVESFGINNKYFIYATSALPLILFEIAKRYFSDAFWDYYHAMQSEYKSFLECISWPNFIMNFIVIFGISLAGTIGGMYFIGKEQGPEAKFMGLSDDPNGAALQDEVKRLKEEYKAFESDPSNYNHEGKFYYKLIPEKTAKQEVIRQKEEILNTQYGITIVQNEDILKQWEQKRAFRIYGLLLTTLFFELIFEICMCFLSRFDFERYTYLKMQGITPTKQEEKRVYKPAPVKEEIVFDYTADTAIQNRTEVVGLAPHVRHTHTPHTGGTQNAVSHVPRGTQPHTHKSVSETHDHTHTKTQPQKKIKKSIEEYGRMERRVRRNFEKSFKEYWIAKGRKELPNDGQLKFWRDLANEEMEQLESVGYKFEQKEKPIYHLRKIQSPKNVIYEE